MEAKYDSLCRKQKLGDSFIPCVYVSSHFNKLLWIEGNKLTLYLPVTKIAEFANSVDLDEVAHNEPPHLDLHCLLSSL